MLWLSLAQGKVLRATAQRQGPPGLHSLHGNKDVTD